MNFPHSIVSLTLPAKSHVLTVHTFCRLKPAAPLKNVILARKKGTTASPAVAHPTPPTFTPSATEEETLVGPSEPAYTARTRASVTPTSEWTAPTGKKSITPEEEEAAATAKDTPTFNPIKEEPFDDDGHLKEAFKSQFVPLPHRLTRQWPGIARVVELDQDRVYSVAEIVDILDETHKTHHEHFEEGVALLRKQMEVTVLTIL